MNKEIILNKIVELNDIIKSIQDGSVKDLLDNLASARSSCSELYNLVDKL